MPPVRIGVGLLVAGMVQACTSPAVTPDPTQSPRILTLKVPATRVAPAETFELAVTAESPDASRLTYRWEVSGGILSDPYAQAPSWRAPNLTYGQDTTIQMTVHVRDVKGREAQRQASVMVSQTP